jgi:hypothetical protein
MSNHRKLTQDELFAEAKRRFGDNPLDFAFACPNCGDVTTLREWKDLLGDTDRAGQDCIGRIKVEARNAAGIPAGRGCDWAAYGLFRGPWEIVVPAEGDRPERSIWGFALAEVSA